MRKNHRLVLVLVMGSSFLAAATVWSRGRIPFPHATHVEEAGVDCSVCHPDAAASGSLKTSLLPANTSVCTAECHQPAELEGWGWSAIPTRKSDFRAFSHKVHLGEGKTCLDCHGDFIHSGPGTEGQVVAGHSVCFQCHDGVKAPEQCEDCHSNLHESRLTDLQPDPGTFKPMSHHPGFLHDHEFEVRLDGKGCAECHRQEDFCSTCHQGDNVDVLVHERNWLYTHPVAARKNVEDCAACHDVGSFCTDCHAQSGIMPGDHLQPGWVDAGLHAQTARRDMQLCSSCHEQDEICVRCHRDPDGILGTQADRNPHPTGFRGDAGHGYWHEDENAACFDCHMPPVPRSAGIGFCGYCHGENPGK